MALSERDKIIHSIWDSLEEADEDASTERLLEMTAERASQTLRVQLDVGDIANAMSRHPESSAMSVEIDCEDHVIDIVESLNGLLKAHALVFEFEDGEFDGYEVVSLKELGKK